MAAEFFRISLPAQVQSLLQLDSLRLENDSFIDQELRDHHSDLLFTVDRARDGQARLYLLFEHKSHPDRGLLHQLRRYQNQIYDLQEETTPVLPVVFYHGSETWNIPFYFQDAMNLSIAEKDAFAARTMNFSYTLVNVGKTNIDELRASFQQKAFWWTLAAIWELESPERLRLFLAQIAEYYRQSSAEFIQKLLVYILKVQDITPVDLRDIVAETISIEQGQRAMTALDRLEEKARQEGQLEGQRKAKLESARNFLQNGVTLEIILKSTGLTREQLIEAGIIER